MANILVTGATGKVGVEVARQLIAQGQSVRIATRNVETARREWGNAAEYVPFDFEQPHTFRPALDGIDGMFLMRPPTLANVRQHMFPFLDLAQQMGAPPVAFLSLWGAERLPFMPHRQVEKHLEQIDLPWTFLRAGFFMQNLSTVHRADIQRDQAIVLPAGRGKTSFIDVRDIAAVAVQALTTPGHARRAYPLTGKESLDYYQVASIFSEVLSRPIIYTKPSYPAFVRYMRQHGASWNWGLMVGSVYLPTLFGRTAGVAPDTERILGRAPITMRQFVSDYRDCWL